MSESEDNRAFGQNAVRGESQAERPRSTVPGLMSQQHKDHIGKLLYTMKQSMIPENVVSILRRKSFTQTDKEHVDAGLTRGKQVEILLERVLLKDDAAFYELVDALRETGQPALADVLEQLDSKPEMSQQENFNGRNDNLLNRGNGRYFYLIAGMVGIFAIVVYSQQPSIIQEQPSTAQEMSPLGPILHCLLREQQSKLDRRNCISRYRVKDIVGEIGDLTRNYPMVDLLLIIRGRLIEMNISNENEYLTQKKPSPSLQRLWRLHRMIMSVLIDISEYFSPNMDILNLIWSDADISFELMIFALDNECKSMFNVPLLDDTFRSKLEMNLEQLIRWFCTNRLALVITVKTEFHINHGVCPEESSIVSTKGMQDTAIALISKNYRTLLWDQEIIKDIRELIVESSTKVIQSIYLIGRISDASNTQVMFLQVVLMLNSATDYVNWIYGYMASWLSRVHVEDKRKFELCLDDNLDAIHSCLTNTPPPDIDEKYNRFIASLALFLINGDQLIESPHRVKEWNDPLKWELKNHTDLIASITKVHGDPLNITAELFLPFVDRITGDSQFEDAQLYTLLKRVMLRIRLFAKHFPVHLSNIEIRLATIDTTVKLHPTEDAWKNVLKVI